MKKSVEIPLGSANELADLFSYTPDPMVRLPDWIGHSFNQTLERDLLYGSWADVFSYGDDERLGVKITSPAHDVSAYETIVPAFLDAGRIALRIYQENRGKISRHGLFFFLPVGMTMVSTRSLQLLHYPPYEARTFTDYLYSPTNRRWETLLGYNGYDGARVTLCERICDAVPLAGPGSDASGIDLFNETFMPYVKAMLKALLDASGSRTQPIVAYGSPVREWLSKAFGSQIPKPLGVLSVVSLQVADGKAATPLICANHPSEFLFFDEHAQDPDWAYDVVRQDLIAAGWQARMSEDWSADPEEVLREVQVGWDARPDDIRQIVQEQETEFGFAHALK